MITLSILGYIVISLIFGLMHYADEDYYHKDSKRSLKIGFLVIPVVLLIFGLGYLAVLILGGIAYVVIEVVIFIYTYMP